MLALGCGSTPSSTPTKDKEKDKAQASKDKANLHAGWWCDEHGIPEDECSMCSDAYAKTCKAKGDWCKEHERAMSQCFYTTCKPERRAFYAAKYLEKFDGKAPPAIPEFDDKKK